MTSFPLGLSQWQRAMTVRKILQEIIEKHPRFHSITPLKTKHVVQWCRCHGYTPPDPETLRNDEDSIEDVLTQIDSEPGERAGTENSFLPEALLPQAAFSGEEISYCGFDFCCCFCFVDFFFLIHSGITEVGGCKGKQACKWSCHLCLPNLMFCRASSGFHCALGALGGPKYRKMLREMIPDLLCNHLYILGKCGLCSKTCCANCV